MHREREREREKTENKGGRGRKEGRKWRSSATLKRIFFHLQPRYQFLGREQKRGENGGTVGCRT